MQCMAQIAVQFAALIHPCYNRHLYSYKLSCINQSIVVQTDAKVTYKIVVHLSLLQWCCLGTKWLDIETRIALPLNLHNGVRLYALVSSYT